MRPYKAQIPSLNHKTNIIAMGGIISREEPPSDTVFAQTDGNDAQEEPAESGQIETVPAKTLDGNTQCIRLDQILQHMQVYQHHESGEVVILLDICLSECKSVMEEPGDWSQVYLSPHAHEEQWRQIAAISPRPVVFASPPPVDTGGADEAVPEAVPEAGRPSHAGDAGIHDV